MLAYVGNGLKKEFENAFATFLPENADIFISVCDTI